MCLKDIFFVTECNEREHNIIQTGKPKEKRGGENYDVASTNFTNVNVRFNLQTWHWGIWHGIMAPLFVLKV